MLPEYMGSAAWLSLHHHQAKKFICTIFLKILGNDAPFALQRSLWGNSLADRVAHHLLHHRWKVYREGGFREIMGNDEIFFEGQGIAVPSISLSRCAEIPIEDRFRGLFPGYHSSGDRPGVLFEEKLREAADLVEALVEVLEKDFVPQPNFLGPIYLYRYDLWLDFDQTGGLGERLNKVMMLMDGELSVFDLAESSGMYFFDCLSFIEQLVELGHVAKPGES
jgi:aminopeptidase-like protein